MNKGEKAILVTGGAGFIGSHLCKKLLEMGEIVIALDNLSTGRYKLLEPLLQNPKFSFIEADIVDEFSLSQNIGKIFNLACPASPVAYQKAPIKTMLTNVIGTLHVLKIVKEHNARMVHASTSEIYGDPIEHPQEESYRGNVNTLGPRACYDEGKRASETLCMDYHRTYGVDVGIVRIFNTYGPNMAPDDGRVVSNFIMQALKGEDITLYGDGMQTRSFQYVDDLVEGLIKMMDSGVRGPINLGNPGEFTMIELAEMVKKQTGCQSKFVFAPIPEDDPRQRKPDISKAKKELNWEPEIPLEEGLKKTIAYFKTTL